MIQEQTSFKKPKIATEVWKAKSTAIHMKLNLTAICKQYISKQNHKLYSQRWTLYPCQFSNLSKKIMF